MAEKVNPFYKLLKTEVPINMASELGEIFDSVNKALSDACETETTRSGKTNRLMDASFKSGGYALMIEDDPDRKYGQIGKRMPPWRLDRKVPPPRNKRCPYTQKIFCQSTWHFLGLHTFSEKHQSQ